MVKLRIETKKRTEVIDLTEKIKNVVKEWQRSGLINIFCPHTTAGLTIQENYDPSVKEDILLTLEKLVPKNYSYRHLEGNADAHIKSVLCGVSLNIPVEDGKLLLGRWQGILFLELDGPREREIFLTFIEIK